MIKAETLTKDWILSVTEKYNNPDPILVEKVIRSFYLLEQLILNKVDLIFKGGTSLILTLSEPRRLSIDIDILISEKPDNLEGIFNKIIESTDFLNYQEVFRDTSSKIEKAHYKFYYKPQSQNADREEPLLLDILFQSNPYPQTQEIEVDSPLLQLQEPGIKVITPTLALILGDKLTAFAPETTGIPYFKNKESMSLQIAKQLFDIGTLFDFVENFAEVSESFKNIAGIELGYRNLQKLTFKDVLNDIYDTSFCLSLRGKSGHCNYEELKNGIKSVRNFIISETFYLERAIVMASKAAYLSAMINNDLFEVKRYSTPEELKDMYIDHPLYNKLNKLKKFAPEAFFYWYQATSLK